jgi:4-carboxymuconolactone decarboxylase
VTATDTAIDGLDEMTLHERGAAVMTAIGGDPAGWNKWEALDPDVGAALRDLLAEACFGAVWSRPAIDLRTRRIMTLTAIATLGRERLLRGHIAGALGQGFTRSEVLEVFLHLVPYTGFPTAISAIECASEVFAEIDGRSAPQVEPLEQEPTTEQEQP